MKTFLALLYLASVSFADDVTKAAIDRYKVDEEFRKLVTKESRQLHVSTLSGGLYFPKVVVSGTEVVLECQGVIPVVETVNGKTTIRFIKQPKS